MSDFLNNSSLANPGKENILAYFNLLRDEFKEIREFILELKNFEPFELDVRHATPIQKALNIAVVISYSRNFKDSRGYKFQHEINSEVISDFTDAENELHEELEDLRDQEFAHSDSRPRDIRFNEYIDVTYSSRVVRQVLDKKQLNMLIQMVSKIQDSIRTHLDKFEL